MKLDAFSKHYGDKLALNFPGLALSAGQTCAVIGANGSGKSTLARCAAGLLRTDQGQAVLEPGCTCGYLPQENYPFRMSVLRNLLLNGDGPDARTRAATLLERLEIAALAGQKAPRLSGGEAARMALARLLMRSYDLLILDEPTAAMDIHGTLLAETLVQDYRRETGCPVLWITHSLTQARRMADQVLFLCDGRVAETGPADKLLSQPDTAELRQFLEFYTL